MKGMISDSEHLGLFVWRPCSGVYLFLLFGFSCLGCHLLSDLVLSLSKVQLGLGPSLLSSGFGLGSRLVGRVGSDGLVYLGPSSFKRVGIELVLGVLGEELIIFGRILSFNSSHVVFNVSSEDVLSQNFSVKFVALFIISNESRLAVGDLNSSISSSLKDGKDLASSGGSSKSNIQKSKEWSGSVSKWLNVVVLSVDGGVSLILISKVQFGESSSGEQQSNSISGSVVGKANRHSKFGQLMGISSSQNVISVDFGVDNLSNDVLVGETGNKSVLGAIVLVLVLDDQSLTGIVISLSLSSSTPFDLVSLEVWLVLLNFDERHD